MHMANFPGSSTLITLPCDSLLLNSSNISRIQSPATKLPLIIGTGWYDMKLLNP